MFSFDTVIRYSQVDPDSLLPISGILDLFQDCADLHSKAVGLGPGFLQSRHRVWFLTSWQLKLYRRPALDDTVRVITNPYQMRGVTGKRSFSILDEKGTSLVEGDSKWVYLDTETGRPARILPEDAEGYLLGEAPNIDFGFSGKSVRPEGAVASSPIPVQRWMLDVNQHVNNSRYAALAGEVCPPALAPHSISIIYQKAAKHGDTFYPCFGFSDREFTVFLDNQAGEPYAVIRFLP